MSKSWQQLRLATSSSLSLSTILPISSSPNDELWYNFRLFPVLAAQKLLTHRLSSGSCWRKSDTCRHPAVKIVEFPSAARPSGTGMRAFANFRYIKCVRPQTIALFLVKFIIAILLSSASFINFRASRISLIKHKHCKFVVNLFGCCRHNHVLDESNRIAKVAS